MTDIFWILVFILAGMFLGISLNELHHHGWREIGRTLKLLANRRSVIIILVASLVALGTIFIPTFFNSKTPDKALYENFFQALVLEPGGVFAFVSGVATVVALILTLQSVLEMRSNIVSFSDLIYRLCDMLDEASSDYPFRMVCYTPALGCLALSDKDYEMFVTNLTKSEDNKRKPRSEIICLAPDELEVWHSRFKGRRTSRKLEGKVTDHVVDDQLLEVAKKDSAEIVQRLRLGDGGDSRVKFLPYQFMPGFYFFFTSTRAIIVAPFFLQNPKGVPRSTGRDALPVEMIGFETTDKGIISTLQRMYDRYKSFPSKLVGDTSELIQPSEIDTISLELSKIKNPSVEKLEQMFRQLGRELQRSMQDDYRQFQNQSQRAELNMRLLYVDSE